MFCNFCLRFERDVINNICLINFYVTKCSVVLLSKKTVDFFKNILFLKEIDEHPKLKI